MDAGSGPRWNVDDQPSMYNGTSVAWDPDQYDTAAMPFVVAIKHHFWSWRIASFAIGTGYVHVDVDLPSAMPDGLTMISFDAGDVAPEFMHTELVGLLSALGGVLLDDPWRYQLRVSDGTRASEFTGTFGPAGGA